MTRNVGITFETLTCTTHSSFNLNFTYCPPLVPRQLYSESDRIHSNTESFKLTPYFDHRVLLFLAYIITNCDQMLSLTNILTLPHPQLTTYIQARRTLPKAKPYTT